MCFVCSEPISKHRLIDGHLTCPRDIVEECITSSLDSFSCNLDTGLVSVPEEPGDYELWGFFDDPEILDYRLIKGFHMIVYPTGSMCSSCCSSGSGLSSDGLALSLKWVRRVSDNVNRQTEKQTA